MIIIIEAHEQQRPVFLLSNNLAYTTVLQEYAVESLSGEELHDLMVIERLDSTPRRCCRAASDEKRLLSCIGLRHSRPLSAQRVTQTVGQTCREMRTIYVHGDS